MVYAGFYCPPTGTALWVAAESETASDLGSWPATLAVQILNGRLIANSYRVCKDLQHLCRSLIFICVVIQKICDSSTLLVSYHHDWLLL